MTKENLLQHPVLPLTKEEALDVTPLLRTPQRWRKTNRHRIAMWIGSTRPTLARCNGVPPQNVEALQKTAQPWVRPCASLLLRMEERARGQIFGLGPPSALGGPPLHSGKGRCRWKVCLVRAPPLWQNHRR